tara:strand:- start:4721 stop:4924 length:204 start_codon:yes stop_codon:yes gene_type:complete
MLPEFKNLTQHELNMADHYAEIGDGAAVARYAQVSKDRGEGCRTRGESMMKGFCGQCADDEIKDNQL